MQKPYTIILCVCMGFLYAEIYTQKTAKKLIYFNIFLHFSRSKTAQSPKNVDFTRFFGILAFILPPKRPRKITILRVLSHFGCGNVQIIGILPKEEEKGQS